LVYNDGHGVDVKFSTFQNILRTFEASFPAITQKKVFKSNEWITKGMKISCIHKHKHDFYQISQTSNNQAVKIYYKKYCKILTRTIREAKCIHYNKLILKSDNKARAIWKIVKDETSKHTTSEGNPVKVNNSVINNPKLIADSFNIYFLPVIEKLKKYTKRSTENEAIQYMAKTIPRMFPDINLLPTTANEIKKNIIFSSQKTHVVTMEYHKNCSKLAQTILVFLLVTSVIIHLLKEPSQNNLNIQKLNLCIQKVEKSCIYNCRPISL
jgi:hypothetical protein